MPSIAAHLVCSKLVAGKLGIKDSDFIKGNILPDIIDISDSHKKIKGKYYYIPNINYFLSTLELNNYLQLGYLTHLLLDKYFLEDYIYDIVGEKDVFGSKIIYKEYDILNFQLLKRFNININNFFFDFTNIPINLSKYYNNINYLAIQKVGETKYLNIDHFSSFLITSSNKIAQTLRQLKR